MNLHTVKRILHEVHTRNSWYTEMLLECRLEVVPFCLCCIVSFRRFPEPWTYWSENLVFWHELVFWHGNPLRVLERLKVFVFLNTLQNCTSGCLFTEVLCIDFRKLFLLHYFKATFDRLFCVCIRRFLCISRSACAWLPCADSITSPLLHVDLSNNL